jgi:hypothetical protein
MSRLEDQLEIGFLGAEDLLVQANGLKRLLAAIADGPALVPDSINVGRRKRPFSEKSCLEALENAREADTRYLRFERKAPPASESGGFAFVPQSAIGTRYDAKFQLAPFAAGGGELLRESVISFMRGLATTVRPVYGWVHSRADCLLGANAALREADEVRADEVYWLNVLGPRIVEHVGRDRMESIPCVHREWLPSGGILFLSHADPTEYASPAARDAQARALAYLRPDRAYDQIRATLDERSKKLAPVAAEFDADVKDLLEEFANATSVAERPAKIVELNRFRPPPVTEVTSDVVTDVEDVDGRSDTYRNRYREQLIALVHSSVPEVTRFQPEVLPSIDHYFYRHDYPGSFDRGDIDRDLVPAVGGFLGQMLVEHLGGRWIPRTNLEESGVEIRGKVWLPFLRAKHYFATKESVLQHSLTQFYRVASRS